MRPRPDPAHTVAIDAQARQLLDSLAGYTWREPTRAQDLTLVRTMFQEWYAQVDYLVARVQLAERARDEAIAEAAWTRRPRQASYDFLHWLLFLIGVRPCPTL